MPARRRPNPFIKRKRCPNLRFERLETRSLLAADMAPVVIGDPYAVGDSSVDDGSVCEVVAVAPPVAEIPAAATTPWLDYTRQDSRGFLVIHIAGTLANGVPDLRMEIVAARLNNTDSGDSAAESWGSQIDGGDNPDEGTCVVFDAGQTDPSPIPVDSPDLLTAVEGDGSFDWYMVVQSKSDFSLGMMMFAVSLFQSGGDSGWSSDGSQEVAAGSIDQPQPTMDAGVATGCESVADAAPVTAQSNMPPAALDTTSISSLAFAASLANLSNAPPAESPRPINSDGGKSSTLDEVAIRPATDVAIGQVWTSGHDDDSGRVGKASLKTSSNSALSDGEFDPLDGGIHSALPGGIPSDLVRS